MKVRTDYERDAYGRAIGYYKELFNLIQKKD